MSRLLKRIFGNGKKEEKLTVETVPAAAPPLPDVADETIAVRIDFVQKLLQLERKNSRLIDATMAAAIMDLNGAKK